MNIPEMSVRNPVATLMLFCAGVVVGLLCLFQAPVDLMPKLDVPAITVMTTYQGASPVDVENKVTEILESSLSTVPELKHITSRSREGVSVITLSFEWGTDLDTRANEVRDVVGMTKGQLPDDVDEPRVLKFDLSRFPILVYGVTAAESYPRLEKLLKDEVADPLKRLPGVASVNVLTMLNRQINVDLDRERLAACGLTPAEVAGIIARGNVDTPAGNLKLGQTDYLLRVPGEVRHVPDLGQLVLKARDGASVRLRDVGTVSDGFAEAQRRLTVNGGRGSILFVQKESQANTVTVARAVRARLPALLRRLPPDVKLVNVMDGSEDIERTVHDLGQTLLIGVLLTVLTVILFLRRWRSALVISLTIPFSLMVAFTAIYFLGYTINMISLFAMIIAVGMIVDNAIVVLENVTRHREEGERPREGAIYGTGEVYLAITASTATTVCIFFPILFVKGISRILFLQFAVVISVTIIASLISAVTLTPMLAATLLRRERFDVAHSSRFFLASERGFNWIAEQYSRLLGWALAHRGAVLVGALLVFVGSVALVPFLGTEFTPNEDRSFLTGSLSLPVGTRLEETSRVMAEVDRVIKETIPEVERRAVFTRCGNSGGGPSSGGEGPHIGSFTVKLVPKAERTRNVREIAAVLRTVLQAQRSRLRLDKLRIETADPMAGMLLGNEKPLTVNIIGDDLAVTDALAAQLKERVANVPGAIDVQVSREKGRPELWVEPDRDRAATLGLSVADVGDTLRAAFYGTTASKYRIQGEEYDVFVRWRAGDRTRREDLLAAPLRGPGGTLLRAQQVARLAPQYGPVEIERKDQGRVVNITGNVEGRSLGEVVADVEAQLAKVPIPEGVTVVMAGQTTDQRESFFWLTLALIIGMLLVYAVMAAQFESLTDPFVVMFSVPFAFTGAIWGLFLFGHHIGIVVFLGLLLLIGVVVNNAIVLVDFTNILRARGLSLHEAVTKAGRARLRPVLMTALTTIVALIPMAFQQGQGSEVWNPLGMTVLGGMLISTLITLILVPTIYTFFDSLKQAAGRRAATGDAA